MIAVRNPYSLLEEIVPEEDRLNKIIEVYTAQVPKLACVKRWFARDIVEMDFAEEFQVKDYNLEIEVGKRHRKMCVYNGNFNFAPEIDVSVYEGDRFARVYLKYDSSVDSEEIEEVREKLKSCGLVRKLGRKSP